MRTGDWIAVCGGGQWFVADPSPEDVRIEDITHALSLVCRFGGHCREFYSVAQHSVIVADILREADPFDYQLQMYGLLHDASEAYIGDVVRPLKRSLQLYRDIEAITQETILRGLGLPQPSEEQRAKVKAADNVALMTERRDLVNHGDRAWQNEVEPLPYAIKAVGPGRARTIFQFRYKTLLDCIEMRGGAR